MRPTVRFAYFPHGFSLAFRDFADMSERIERGLQAFEAGMLVGWHDVEQALRRYRVMPDEFFEDSAAYFSTMRQALSLRVSGPLAAAL